MDIGSTSDPLKVIILADTNRDGRIDEADHASKDVWTRQSGALFLANIVDTDRRCSSMIQDSTPDEELDRCHDASDDVLRNAKYLAPLQTVPNPRLRSSATGSIVVKDKLAASRVRVFYREQNDWIYLTPNYTFRAEHLKTGLELGIDARDVRRPGVWDGRATVEIITRDGAEEARDSVALRVAPVLTHHHGQQARVVLTQSSLEFRASIRGHNPWQGNFVAGLQGIEAAPTFDEAMFLFNDTTTPDSDVWAQDYFEPGYSSIPGRDGPVFLRIMIRSAQSWRPSGRQIFQFLRSSTVGAVQHLDDGGTTDSLGNLETIPPHTHNGISYPAGRTIMGIQHGREPFMIDFLTAQEEQSPVKIDTSWLIVGHTDEFVQFLPVNNTRGWVMMVSDSEAGLEMLQDAQRAGHGGALAMSRPRLAGDDPNCLPTDTIDQVLQMANLTSLQYSSAAAIQKTIDTVKKETGITDEDIIRVPCLYYYDDKSFFSKKCKGLSLRDEGGSRHGKRRENGRSGGARTLSVLEAGTPPGHLRRRKESDDVSVCSLYPNAINSLVLGGTEVVAPNPWGPVIDGKDLISEAVTAAYAKINYTVRYLDDWYSHHMGTGEVHCGTNTIRDMTENWW